MKLCYAIVGIVVGSSPRNVQFDDDNQPGWTVVRYRHGTPSPPAARSRTPPIPGLRIPKLNRSASVPYLRYPSPVRRASTPPVYTNLEEVVQRVPTAIEQSWRSYGSPEEGRLRRQSSEEEFRLRATPSKESEKPHVLGWPETSAMILQCAPNLRDCLEQAHTWPLWVNEESSSDLEDSIEWNVDPMLDERSLQHISSCVHRIDSACGNLSWLEYSLPLRRRIAEAAIQSGAFLGVSADPRRNSEYFLTPSDVLAIQDMSEKSHERGSMRHNTGFVFVPSDSEILMQLARQWNMYHCDVYVPAGSRFMRQLENVSREVHEYELKSSSPALFNQYAVAYKLDKLATSPELTLLSRLPDRYFNPDDVVLTDRLAWNTDIEKFVVALPLILSSPENNKGAQLTNESCLLFQAWAIANRGRWDQPTQVAVYLKEDLHMCMGRVLSLDLAILPMIFYRLIANLDGARIDYVILKGFFHLASAFDMAKLDTAARLRAAAIVNIVPGWFRTLRDGPIVVSKMFEPFLTKNRASLSAYADILDLADLPFAAETHVSQYQAIRAARLGEDLPDEVFVMMETIGWFVRSVEGSNWLTQAPWLFITRHFGNIYNRGGAPTLGRDIGAVHKVCEAIERIEKPPRVEDARWPEFFSPQNKLLDPFPASPIAPLTTACFVLKEMEFRLIDNRILHK